MANNTPHKLLAPITVLLARCDALEAHLIAVHSFSRQNQSGIARSLRKQLRRIALQLGEGPLAIVETVQFLICQERVLSVFEGAADVQQREIQQLVTTHHIPLEVAIAVAGIQIALRATEAVRALAPHAPETLFLALEREQTHCTALCQRLLTRQGTIEDLRAAFDALWQVYLALEDHIELPDPGVLVEVSQ